MSTKGRFLGHIVTATGIKANVEKVHALLNTKSPRTIKDIQSLNEKLAALGWFLVKSKEQSMPFFYALKAHMGKGDIPWTKETKKKLYKS